MGIDVGLRNLSYCLLTGKGRLACWTVVDLLEQPPGLVLSALFQNFVDLHVGIESQPRWNRPMWLLSRIVFEYFRARLGHGVLSVRFLRAHRKYNPRWLRLSCRASSYVERKGQSILLCRASALHRFERASKKDDLADSLLLTLLLLEDTKGPLETRASRHVAAAPER